MKLKFIKNPLFFFIVATKGIVFIKFYTRASIMLKVLNEPLLIGYNIPLSN